MKKLVPARRIAAIGAALALSTGLMAAGASTANAAQAKPAAWCMMC